MPFVWVKTTFPVWLLSLPTAICNQMKKQYVAATARRSRLIKAHTVNLSTVFILELVELDCSEPCHYLAPGRALFRDDRKDSLRSSGRAVISIDKHTLILP